MQDNEFNEQPSPEPCDAPPEPCKTPLDSYKTVCAKLGLTMCVFYICRILNGIIAGLIGGFSGMSDSSPGLYLLHVAVTVVLNYIVPITFAITVFRSLEHHGGKFRALYKKPKRLARAFGNFPAMYGLGFGMALLTLLASLLISKVSGGQSIVEDLFKPVTLEPSTNIVNVLTMVVLIVVIAPVFEEFLVRGIIYDALKPYGCGIAVIISSILFGLMHGSLYMLFYTTALGFALAYVRYATDSLFVVTILHSIINSVGAGMLLISSLAEITDGENKLVNTVLSVYILAMLILIVVGVIAFARKIPVIRKYKIENAWTEVGAGKKMALFFLSAPVIIMIIFAVDEHLNNRLLGLIIR